MAKTAKDFITLLLQKAGVKMDDETITQALALPELATVQIPDALVTPIDNGLLSLQAAKNNHPEVQSHYKAQIYDGVDKTLLRVIDEYKLSDEVKNEILSEKSSTKRIELLTAKLKDEAEKKSNAGKGEKDQLAQEIAKLNGELKEIKEREKGIHEKHQQEVSEIRMNYALGGLLGGYKTKFDDLPQKVKETTLKQIINDSLSADAAEFTVDDNGNLMLRKRDGNNFFGEDHTVLTPKSYLDKILARDKILIVNDPQQGASTQKQNGQQRPNSYVPPTQQQNGGNNNGKAANPVLASLAQEALKSFSGNGV
jgi:hypothetical protein